MIGSRVAAAMRASGDSLYFDAQIPHRVRSAGAQQAQVLIVVHDAQAEAQRD
ncbi:cupin domain-containing protein [Lysobacter yananisis]|uniref:Cupin domain-containing protein n=1 Tax=Lysobacter yananisis TaxID=1003114 RepID=A0ABY9P2J1_9GAMM|nr:cupin domain-containing protein [Lysobacter yananisis]WMT01184.1 cupin domain-containing protein [Lysobacter yananisis]